MSTITPGSARAATTNGRQDARIIPTPTSPTPPTASIIERIKARAFEIYQARKGGPGDATADWIEAERQILGKPVQQARSADARRMEQLTETKHAVRGETLLRSGEP